MKRTPLARFVPLRRSSGIARFRAKQSHDLASGKTWHSQGERDYWGTLLIRQRVGEISALQRQVKVTLIPRDDASGAPEIAWHVDFAYIEDGRQTWCEYKRPPTVCWRGRVRSLWTDWDRKLLDLWQHFGPGLLLVVGARGEIRRVMGNGGKVVY